MHFRHISAKVQAKNLKLVHYSSFVAKQHFDEGFITSPSPLPPLRLATLLPAVEFRCDIKQNKVLLLL